jgi:hypothetical protein
VDESYVDACAWDPFLNGSIGLYTQKCGDVNGFFLICVSDFTHIGSHIMRSMKSDLGNSISVFDFCDSKEMWFLESIALRNRQRLILQAATCMGISVAQKIDLSAHSMQEDPNLAVEICSSLLDHIECKVHVNAKTNLPETRVRHYRACTDVKYQKGPFPISLGDVLGFILIFPEKINYLSFSNFCDTMPFTNNHTCALTHLWPTTNVTEQCRANIDKISAAQHSIVHMTIDDIIHDMQYRNISIPSHIMEFLTSMDEYSSYIFYGVKYAPGIPIVIYPKILPSFVNCTRPLTETHDSNDLQGDSNALLAQHGDRDSTTASSGHTDDVVETVIVHGIHAVNNRRDPVDNSDIQPTHNAPTVLAASNDAHASFNPSNTSLNLQQHTQHKNNAAPEHFSFSLQSDKKNKLVDLLCNTCTFSIHDNIKAEYASSKQSNLLCFDTNDTHYKNCEVAIEWDDEIISMVQKMSMTNNPKIDSLLLTPHAIFNTLSHYAQGIIDP